jgi:hypothetical protein
VDQPGEPDAPEGKAVTAGRHALKAAGNDWDQQSAVTRAAS